MFIERIAGIAGTAAQEAFIPIFLYDAFHWLPPQLSPALRAIIKRDIEIILAGHFSVVATALNRDSDMGVIRVTLNPDGAVSIFFSNEVFSFAEFAGSSFTCHDHSPIP